MRCCTHLLAATVGAAVLLGLCSCGGTARSASPLFPSSPHDTNARQAAQAPTVQPSSLICRVGDSWTLQASAAVTWSVAEGTAGGTITAAGVYTAPAAPGTYHVTATLASESSLSTTVIVTVMERGFTVAGEISPQLGGTTTLLPGGDVVLIGGLKGFASSMDPFCPDVYLREVTIFHAGASTFARGAATLEPRAHHTATLLPNGKILVAGGDLNQGCSESMVNTAELYDPATDTFSATGTMATARGHFSATLLANGKVLVAGGWSKWPSAGEATAELYDPATGAFSSTGPMNTGRAGHRAILLASGKVLMMGGHSGIDGSFAAGIEVYDPVNGTFSSIGTMETRYEFSATLLPDGTVLIAGGTDGRGAIYNSIEQFDPMTGTMTRAGTMLAPRSEHTATLLPSGAVLLAGGLNYTTYTTWSTAIDAAESYDPNTHTSSVVAPLHYRRAGHNATLLPDGRVLITGGDTSWAELF